MVAHAGLRWISGFGILVAALIAQAASAGEAPRPNIVIILADDMGYSDLGCYGGEIATPNLDGLARGGLRFTRFYNTARCWPSRAALLTGYYPQQVRRDALPERAGGAGGVRPPWARLLPEFLKSAGYHRYHSGKWHVDGPVLAGGFERSLRVAENNYFHDRGNQVDDRPVAKGGQAPVADARSQSPIRLAWGVPHGCPGKRLSRS